MYSNSEDETSSSCESEDSSLEMEEDSDAEDEQSTPTEEVEGCLIDTVTRKKACEGTLSVKQTDNTETNVQNTTDL